MTILTASPSSAAEELASSSSASRAERLAIVSAKPKKADQIANMVVLAILFCAPALMCLHAASATDFDLGWHLRTGEWILQYHAVPQADPFSAIAGKPWQAYSWLFEVILTKLFQHLGLVGVVAYTTSMVFAITIAVYQLVKRLQADLSLRVLLTYATCFSLSHLYTPRPWLFTILFFALELNVLTHVRRTGRLRELLWLPLIFCLWANIHIEFIDGLLVLGLAFAESIVARWWSAAETQVKPAWMGAALLSSLLATLANPYGWRVYSVVYDYSSRLAESGSALNRVSELQALPFRDLPDFLILAFALASVAALAWQRRFVFFESCLLLFAAFASFRSQRDLWVMALVSAMILASHLKVARKTAIRVPGFAVPVAFALAALMVFTGFRVWHVNNTALQGQIEKVLPARAVKAIQVTGYNGTIYDDYTWGGYLMWALRLPVTMDGRASFYGDQRIDRSVATWSGEPDWASDPDLKSAGIVIGPVKTPLIQLLRTDQQYRLIYEDKLAAVFARN